jgi:hypothetical protein
MTSLRERVAQDDPQLPLWTPAGKYEAAFLRHRAKHPEVFDQLVSAAREAKARGWTRIGIRALWERARWRKGPKVRDESGFFLNDHLTSYYAREIVRTCPDIAPMFELRGTR